ncbi:MAG: putative rane protein [Deltaproteobacteria bacterium]|nr:putative rane protein [Deltaproteobacteria bacterium]
MGIRRGKGFIVIEILIAGLILTSSIAATMYLFRMGFEYLERANQSNVLASKLTQATGLIQTLDLQKKSGEEDIGGGISLKWDLPPRNVSLPGGFQPALQGDVPGVPNPCVSL